MIPHAPPGSNGPTDTLPPAERPTLSPSEPPDPFGIFGEPFTSFARLLVAADDARRHLWRLRVGGDANAVFAAEAALDEATAAVERFRHHGACAFLLCARFAADLFPGAIQVHLDPAFRRELSTAQDAIRDLVDRINDIETAVVQLECGEEASS